MGERIDRIKSRFSGRGLSSELTETLPQSQPIESDTHLESSRQETQRSIRTSLQEELAASTWQTRLPAERLLKVASNVIESGDSIRIAAASELIEYNTLDGIEVTLPLGKYIGGDDRLKAARLLEIFNHDPEVAKVIVRHSVAGFHGSLSGSLWGVLEQGALLPAAEARVRGQMISTGERTYSIEGGQPTTSFADWREPETIREYAPLDSAPTTIDELTRTLYGLRATYAAEFKGKADNTMARNTRLGIEDLQKRVDSLSQNPDTEEARLILDNFPIAYGLYIRGYDLLAGVTDVPQVTKNVIFATVPSEKAGEFAVVGEEIPLASLPVIAVPQGQIQRVKALLKQFGYADQLTVIDLSLVID